MPTTLDRLKELSELLRSMLFMEDGALQAALDEGFRESPPEWSSRLSRHLWANSLLTDIKNTSELLDERLMPPGAVKTIQAHVKVDPITIHAVTAEEKEALRHAQKETQSDGLE